MSATSKLPDYELPSSFYLGKKYEINGRKLLDEKVLYNAKDLTTHAVCVGMTGSGKTGLCLAMLEEAALDGIPAICIDPKGDIGNLLLAFPEMRASDFEPWIDPGEASRKSVSPEQYAEQTAHTWREGLASWDQQPERVARFKNAADIAIYTPGSNVGIPVTVLRSFNAPPKELIDDSELFRERIAGAASGLLTLLGIEADPLNSREHILLSNIFDQLWRDGRDLDLPTLIRSIQSPPMDKIGVFDLDSFFPAADRNKLAVSLNNLLASPTFSGWLEGQPLDIKSLLYTSHGKPRISILSIAHLSDTERMFFVTILLNELLAWMRTQTGTTSLRALFYMDEIYGYFPPTAKPPSKPPMMVLLKQARAFGLGVVLATQNPVDLDYKGLANIGTWFLGRLQTQRDKDRIIDGLEGAAAQTGTRFDKTAMSETLSALGSRVFLMNNVHNDSPIVFQSRWAMSYLRGPLARPQIQRLMDLRRSELMAGLSQRAILPASNANGQAPDESSTATSSQQPRPSSDSVKNARPIVPHGVTERFWIASQEPAAGTKRIYRPGILATAACRYVQASTKLDSYFDKSLLFIFKDAMPEYIWREATDLPPFSFELASNPDDGFETFDDVPGAMLNEKFHRNWRKELADELYRNRPITLFYCKELDKTSNPGQDEVEARVSWTQEIRELRDIEKEKLQQKYAKQLQTLENKIRTAQQRLDKQQAQYDREWWNTALNAGTSMLGKLLGNRRSTGRTASAGRGALRTIEKRGDVSSANDTLGALMEERAQIDQECQREVEELKGRYSPEGLTLESIELRCRKSDIKVDLLCLVWIPWQISKAGIATPLVKAGIG